MGYASAWEEALLIIHQIEAFVGPNPFLGVIYHWIGGFASATNFIPFPRNQALVLGGLLAYPGLRCLDRRPHTARVHLRAERLRHSARSAPIEHRLRNSLGCSLGNGRPHLRAGDSLPRHRARLRNRPRVMCSLRNPSFRRSSTAKCSPSSIRPQVRSSCWALLSVSSVLPSTGQLVSPRNTRSHLKKRPKQARPTTPSEKASPSPSLPAS